MRGRTHQLILILLLIIAVFFSLQENLFAKDKLLSACSGEFTTGSHSRIIKLIAERLGLDLDLRYVSFARRLVLMEEGKIDLSVGFYKTEKRGKYIYYVEPPYRTKSNVYFFVLKGSGLNLENYADLYPLTIATSIGAKYFDKFDSDSQLNKVRVSRVEQKFKMLLMGRVDAVIHSSRAMKVISDLEGGDDIEIARYYYSDANPVYIGISRRSDLMNRLDEVEPVIKKMIENGEIENAIKAGNRLRPRLPLKP